jgi:uncharacterized protein (DUF1330 family)
MLQMKERHDDLLDGSRLARSNFVHYRRQVQLGSTGGQTDRTTRHRSRSCSLENRRIRPRLTAGEKEEGGPMPAYWVARSRIADPVAYKKYTDRVPAIIAKYGGRVLARGGRFQIMEGPDKFQRFVVIEFDTLEQGVACFHSPEYVEAAAFRRNGAGEVETIMVEGGDATKV